MQIFYYVMIMVDEFVKYLNTQKEAHEIDNALGEVKAGKTNDVSKLLNALYDD